MIGARNVKVGLALLALSLVGGLVLSLWSFQPMLAPPPGYARYDELPRRLMRLAHVAAVMLPLINVVAGLLIDRVAMTERARRGVSVGLLAGALWLPGALAAEALWPPLRILHLAGIPAVAFTAAVATLAWRAWNTAPTTLLSSVSRSTAATDVHAAVTRVTRAQTLPGPSIGA